MGSSENIAKPEASQEKCLQFKRLGYTLTLVISPDSLSCGAVYQPSSNGAPLTNDELRGFLSQSKIVEGLMEDAIASLLVAAAEGKTFNEACIARGLEMIPGEDGRIELVVSDALEDQADEENETNADDEKIDLRHVQSFLNVTADQLVGKILPPGRGTPGKNVHGRIIQPKSGAPFTLQLEKNIRLGDDGASLYTETDGRLCIKGNEISVENTYAVKGDVDFKVGNIVFNGFLEIKGDVLDGFRVSATKGISIQGNIGVCDVSSDGDISFCGVSGQGKGTIKCGGMIKCNFISDAHVDCEGDIIAETEIRTSYIHCNGEIRVNKGILAGGEYIALGGIESNILGTVSSLKTRVVAGICQRDLLELNDLFNKLKELIEDFKKTGGGISPEEFTTSRAEITARIQEVRTRDYPRRNPKINVKKKLHDGVTITIGNLSEDVREGKDGPFTMIENTIEGGFRYIGLTDLSVKAADIEKAFVQQYEMMQQKELGENK